MSAFETELSVVSKRQLRIDISRADDRTLATVKADCEDRCSGVQMSFETLRDYCSVMHRELKY